MFASSGRTDGNNKIATTTHKFLTFQPSSIKQSIPMLPQPVHAVRKLLRSLHKGLARDEELRTLHITVSELSSPVVASSSAAETITNFFQAEKYQTEMGFINKSNFPNKRESYTDCLSRFISDLLRRWTNDIVVLTGRKVRNIW